MPFWPSSLRRIVLWFAKLLKNLGLPEELADAGTALISVIGIVYTISVTNFWFFLIKFTISILGKPLPTLTLWILELAVMDPTQEALFAVALPPKNPACSQPNGHSISWNIYFWGLRKAMGYWNLAIRGNLWRLQNTPIKLLKFKSNKTKPNAMLLFLRIISVHPDQTLGD